MIKLHRFLGITGLLCIILSLMVWSIYGRFQWIFGVTAICGLIGIADFMIMDFETIKQFLSLKSTRRNAGLSSMIVLMISILIVINYFLSQYHKRIDLSENKSFSLSEQTIKIISNLEKEILILHFYKGKAEQKITDLFKEYSYCSDKLKFNYVDLDKKPGLAKKYNVISYGNSIFQLGDQTQQISKHEEQDITQSILKLISGVQKKIYFLKGHGERDLFNEKLAEGYLTCKKYLEGENYLVEEVELFKLSQVPADCEVLLLVGPQNPLFVHEIRMIQEYLSSRRGHMAVFLDPDSKTDLKDLFKKYHILIRSDLIIDPNPVGQLFGMGPTVPVINTYPAHAITDQLGTRITFFPLSRSIVYEDSFPQSERSYSVTPFIQTSENSWGEIQYAQEKAEFDPRVDAKGPLVLALALEERLSEDPVRDQNKSESQTPQRSSRLVIMGDADFASNQFIGMQQNADLFLNAINWLSESEDLISIRPKPVADRRLAVSKSQAWIIFYVTIIGYPSAILFVGFVVWFHRRKG